MNLSTSDSTLAQVPAKPRTEANISVLMLRANPENIYVFGDNLLRRGTAGQAVIRGEPNAFGIPVKRGPAILPSAFFSDQPDELQALLKALRELYSLSRTKTIVFPVAGIGTGLAGMAAYSPEAYRQMTSILSTHFGIDQD